MEPRIKVIIAGTPSLFMPYVPIKQTASVIAFVVQVTRLVTQMQNRNGTPRNTSSPREDKNVEYRLDFHDSENWILINNNTIDKIIAWSEEKQLFFYGVTVAAAAHEFHLKRFCFETDLR